MPMTILLLQFLKVTEAAAEAVVAGVAPAISKTGASAISQDISKGTEVNSLKMGFPDGN